MTTESKATPLQRYYLSWAGIALSGFFAWAAGPGYIQLAAIIFLFLLAAYMAFVRCPRCGIRLSAMGNTPGVHGLPGRYCARCGADLNG